MSIRLDNLVGNTRYNKQGNPATCPYRGVGWYRHSHYKPAGNVLE